MASYFGGCSCGAVRFELDGAPQWINVCHCDACKKRTGSAYGVSFVYAADNLKTFVGETKAYIRMGESGKKVRYEFCPHCGTTIRWDVEIVPGRQIFAGGAFDEMSKFKVTGEMYTGKAIPWARLGCDLARTGEPDADFRNLLMERAKSFR